MFNKDDSDDDDDDDGVDGIFDPPELSAGL